MAFLLFFGICFCTLHVTVSGKSGVCPPKPRIRGQLTSCNADADCPGKRKCCYTVNGRECVKAHDKGKNPSHGSGPCPPAEPRVAGKWVDMCDNDASCPGKQKCCDTRMGNRCTDVFGQESKKKGSCPPVPKTIGEKFKCAADSDCPGKRRCCYTIEGRECVKPKDENSFGKAPGQCPPAGERVPGKWIDKCRQDSNCPKDQKCCDTEMGNRCTEIL